MKDLLLGEVLNSLKTKTVLLLKFFYYQLLSTHLNMKIIMLSLHLWYVKRGVVESFQVYRFSYGLHSYIILVKMLILNNANELLP